MKISVVTVVFNNVGTIEQAVRSVAAQSYADKEHIVIDGGSTDGTVEVLSAYRDRLGCLISEPDRGMYDAMNKGLARARGDIIGTLNADDFYADDTVLEQVAAVFRDPQVDACYADLVYVDRASAQDVVRYWQSSPFRKGLFSEGWCPPHPTFFVRRSVYEKYGTFDLTYKLAADVELMMRFLEACGVRSAYVPRTWVKMRMGGVSNGSLRNVVLQNLYIARAARQHRVPLNPAGFLMRKVISRTRQRLVKPM